MPDDTELLELQARGIEAWRTHFEAGRVPLSESEVAAARDRRGVAASDLAIGPGIPRLLLDWEIFDLVERGERTAAALMAVVPRSATVAMAAHTLAQFARGGAVSPLRDRLTAEWHVQFLAISKSEAILAGRLLEAVGGVPQEALLVATAVTHRASEIYTSNPETLAHMRLALSQFEGLHRAFAIVDLRSAKEPVVEADPDPSSYYDDFSAM